MENTQLTILEYAKDAIIDSKPFEVPVLPPHPVFDEHISLFLNQTGEFTECKTLADFEFAKQIATAGAKLKNSIGSAYRELKQAIDAIKNPVLEAEKRDVGRVETEVKRIDALALAYAKEQQRIAQEEAEKKERERIAKIKADQEAEAAMARMWDEPEKAKAIEAQPIPEERPVTADAGVSYRRGARKETWKATVVEPSNVKREYCDPSQSRINIEVNAYFHQLKHPSPDQIKKIEEKIGGVKIALG